VKIYGYYNRSTNTVLDSRATLRVEFTPTRHELVETLAAAAPAFHDNGELIEWSAGDHPGDLSRARVETMIVVRLRTHGEGEHAALWHEDVDEDDVDARRDWAVRMINRCWGAAFATADMAVDLQTTLTEVQR
jgi:hypothetical protein